MPPWIHFLQDGLAYNSVFYSLLYILADFSFHHNAVGWIRLNESRENQNQHSPVIKSRLARDVPFKRWASLAVVIAGERFIEPHVKKLCVLTRFSS